MLSRHRRCLYLLFRHLEALDQSLLTWSDLVHAYDAFEASDDGAPLRETELAHLLRRTQEAVVAPPLLYLAVRDGVADWTYVEIHTLEMEVQALDVSEYLEAKEQVVDGARGERYTLEVDFTPFERDFPKLDDAAAIGHGVEFLNDHLCERLRQQGPEGRERLFDFLRLHQVNNRPLMLSEQLSDADDLRDALARALDVLEAEEDGWVRTLRALGFESGWGDSAERVAETMEMLVEVMEEPDPETLAAFLARIPMIFSIAIVSPHGYFGQANVLGKPDTGGQVVYILDQVRALERAMRKSIREQGLDVEPDIVVLTRLIPDAGGTDCDLPREHILGTENARILRIPFRDRRGEIQEEWISRFEIWPYLERYAVEAERTLLAELGGRPDMIIGNYSDGNMVASIISHRLKVTQCNIAHALEKTKYPQSALRWKEYDDDNHFACQFTADLIAMNAADFIITSTYQEIAGTGDSVGQYESYRSFTLPDLYRVVSGVDCYDPKFNIVSPGADANVFFPYWEEEQRTGALRAEIRRAVHGEPDGDTRGHVADTDKPLLFAMSRLDRVKNMTGFLEWYGRSEELQEEANLLLVGGTLDPQRSSERDEHVQIELTHELLDRYDLDDRVRWLPMETDKNRVGELYRFVADSRGAFVQPALFEAFGLTVVESMSSGLPTFATRFGGPLEIIQDGVSGFHVDPTAGDEAARIMADFLRRSREDPDVWTAVSQGSVERVQARYTWKRYASTLLELSRIYGFWRHITSLEREETWRYLEMFYGLMYRPLAEGVAEDGTDPAAG